MVLELRHYVNLFWTVGLYGAFVLQLPILIVILGQVGVLHTQQLSSSRPYVLLGCLIFGMLLTPPDMFGANSFCAATLWPF